MLPIAPVTGPVRPKAPYCKFGFALGADFLGHIRKIASETSHFCCAAQRREEILGRFLRNRGGRWPDTDF